jgi:hypothetical protein
MRTLLLPLMLLCLLLHSTLLGLISGHLEPTSGYITRNPEVGDQHKGCCK